MELGLLGLFLVAESMSCKKVTVKCSQIESNNSNSSLALTIYII